MKSEPSLKAKNLVDVICQFQQKFTLIIVVREKNLSFLLFYITSFTLR